MEGDTTVTRVFLVLDDDDKVYASPKGVYFETLMSRADEMWISKSVKDKGNDSPLCDGCPQPGNADSYLQH